MYQSQLDAKLKAQHVAIAAAQSQARLAPLDAVTRASCVLPACLSRGLLGLTMRFATPPSFFAVSCADPPAERGGDQSAQGTSITLAVAPHLLAAPRSANSASPAPGLNACNPSWFPLRPRSWSRPGTTSSAGCAPRPSRPGAPSSAASRTSSSTSGSTSTRRDAREREEEI